MPAVHGLHSRNVIHSDPRIGNALLQGDSLKWIDFPNSVSVTKVDMRRDVKILY
jgi:tRNA A-37 threonylcarbamoyl transferase component Bud32